MDWLHFIMIDLNARGQHGLTLLHYDWFECKRSKWIDSISLWAVYLWIFGPPCIYASRKAPFDFEMRSIFSCFIIAILRAKARFWWGVSSKQNSHFVWMRTTRNDACWKVLFLSRKSKWLFMRVNPLTVLQICIMMHILRWKNVHCNKAITQHFIYLPFWDARFLIEKYFRLI